MKSSKKIIAAVAVLLLAAALFVGAGAADEPIPVDDEAGLIAAVGTADFNIVLGKDIPLTEVLVITQPGTIDGAGNSITFVNEKAKYATDDGVIRVALDDAAKKVTLKDLGIIGPMTDGTGPAPGWKSNAVPLKAFGGTVEVDGVTIMGGNMAILSGLQNPGSTYAKVVVKGDNTFEKNSFDGINIEAGGELVVAADATVNGNDGSASAWVNIGVTPYADPDTTANFCLTTNPDNAFTYLFAPAEAKIGTTYYAKLVDAFTAAEDGDTITLLTNASGGGLATFVASKWDSQGVTLDLNGKTYTATDPAVGSHGTENQLMQVLKGNKLTITNGTLITTNDSGLKKNFKFIIQNYGDLTLVDVTLDGSNLALAGQTHYALSNNCGTVIIKDTTITAADGDVAFDVCKYSSYAEPHVTVEGNSVITGKIEYTLKDTENTGALTIKGGTFYGDFVVGDTYATSAAQNLKIEAGSFTDLASALKYAASGASITITEDAGADDAVITIPAGVTVTFAPNKTLTAKELTVAGKLIADKIVITSADTLVVSGEVDVAEIQPPAGEGKFIEMQGANAKLVISDGSAMDVDTVLGWIEEADTAGAKVEKVTTDGTGAKITETVEFTAAYDSHSGTDIKKVTQKSAQKETQGGDVPSQPSEAVVTLEAAVSYKFFIPSEVVLNSRTGGTVNADVGFKADMVYPDKKIQITLDAKEPGYATDHYELKSKTGGSNVAQYQILKGETAVISGGLVVDDDVTADPVTETLTYKTLSIEKVDSYTGTITFTIEEVDA